MPPSAPLPLDRIVIETDSPYLAPHPHRGRRNESAYVALVAERIAALKEIDLDASRTRQPTTPSTFRFTHPERESFEPPILPKGARKNAKSEEQYFFLRSLAFLRAPCGQYWRFNPNQSDRAVWYRASHGMVAAR